MPLEHFKVEMLQVVRARSKGHSKGPVLFFHAPCQGGPLPQPGQANFA